MYMYMCTYMVHGGGGVKVSLKCKPFLEEKNVGKYIFASSFFMHLNSCIVMQQHFFRRYYLFNGYSTWRFIIIKNHFKDGLI